MGELAILIFYQLAIDKLDIVDINDNKAFCTSNVLYSMCT